MRPSKPENPTHRYQYHPALPSIEEAKKDYSQVTSDHVPFKVTIKPNKGNPITIVSWNGFAEHDNYNETVDQRAARHRRIVESLRRMVEQHNPDFICLQEIKAPGAAQLSYLFYGIHREISVAVYSPVITMGEQSELVDCGGCITFYDHTRWSQNTESKDMQGFYHPEGNITTFKERLLTEERYVRILNVHHQFSAIPEGHEKTVREFLSQNKSNTLSVVIGDFNGAIAPVNDGTPMNLVTSVAPPMFRGGKLQGACAIDGSFHTKDGKTFHQDKIEPLDPNSGGVFPPSALQPNPDVPELPRVKEEILEQRMLICVDVYYQQTYKIAGKPLFEYQQYLRHRLGSNDIVVRPTRDINNKQGIGIALPMKLAHQFFCSDSDRQYSLNWSIPGETTNAGHLIIITVALDKRDWLLKKISQFLSEQAPETLGTPGWRERLWKSPAAPALKDKKLGYRYEEDGQPVTLSIDPHYHYTYEDITAVWGPRIGLLNQYLREQSLLENPISITMPKKQILWDENLIQSFRAFLDENKSDVDGSQFFFIPFEIKGEWSALIMRRVKTGVKQEVTLYGAPALDTKMSNIRSAIGSAYFSGSSPQIPYYPCIYYIHTNPASSGVVAIETAVQMVKNIFDPDQFKLGHTWCDANAMILLRGDHLRILGGPQAALYAKQYANKEEEQADTSSVKISEV